MKRLSLYVVVFVSLVVITLPSFLKPASAYHLYTHAWTTENLFTDLNDGDGGVNINGREYPVATPIVQAILTHPDFYNAGVIGPDLFPDIAYGQSIIHPSRTGAYLLTLYSEAWRIFLDQHSPYSQTAKLEILAFTYGYLTHAAGDMWAHTLINDFSGGIFPSYLNVLTDPTGSSALIALRHTVVESYIEAATPGVDNSDSHDLEEVAMVCDTQNPEFYHDSSFAYKSTLDFTYNPTPNTYYKCNTTVPGTLLGSDDTIVPDRSNVGTPGIVLPTGDEWDSPQGSPSYGVSRFLYDALVSPSANTPDFVDPQSGNGRGSCAAGTFDVAGCPDGPYQNWDFYPQLDRGLVINFFLDLKASLQIAQAGAQERLDFPKCYIDFHGCERSDKTIDVLTVRGHYSLNVKRYHDQCYDDNLDVSCVSDPDRLNRPAGCLSWVFLNCKDLTTVPGDIWASLKLEYVKDWIPGIDAGLTHWSDFWLGFAKGFADPQTYRDAQNDHCKNIGRGTGAETDDRLKCEMKVSKLTSISYALDHLYPSSDDGFGEKYLCPMFGPLFVAGCAVSDALGTIMSALDDFFSLVGVRNLLDPIVDWVHDIKESFINFVVESFIGVDMATLEQFTQNVTQWMCGLSNYTGAPTVSFRPLEVFNFINIMFGTSLPLPPPVQLTLTPPKLFSSTDHERLDNLMGLGPDHHSQSEAMLENVPQDCFTLNDSAKFDPDKFAAFRNTEVMTKLIVLGGSTLNRVIGDNLVADGLLDSARFVQTYENDTVVYDPSVDTNPMTPGDDYVVKLLYPSVSYPGVRNTYLHDGPANIMLDSLPQSEANDPWLELIDGDHAWRQDGLPSFCTPDPPPVQPTLGHVAPESCSTNPDAAPRLVNPSDRSFDMPNAGTGRFPLWESCLARPVFRDLFKDWENGDNNFPELADAVSSDPSVGTPPIAYLAVTGPVYTQTNILGLSSKFVDENNQFTLSETDNLFDRQALSLYYRVYKSDSLVVPPFQTIANGGTFSIPAALPSGMYSVDYYATSPCMTSPTQTDTFFLLNSPPVPPILLNPEDKANATSVHFSWKMGSLTYTEPESTPVYSPDPGIASFNIQVGTSPTFATTPVDATVLADYGGGVVVRQPPIPGFALNPSLPDGTYYWRVRATDIAGHVGQFSNPRRFTLDTTPPTLQDGFLCSANFGGQLGCQSDPTIVGPDGQIRITVYPAYDPQGTTSGTGIRVMTAAIIGPSPSDTPIGQAQMSTASSRVPCDTLPCNTSSPPNTAIIPIQQGSLYDGTFTFPIATSDGRYKVTVTAEDWAGNSAQLTIYQTAIYDRTPPILTVPQSFTIEATGPNGRTVSYSTTAVDNIDGPITPSCSPASGSTFLLDAVTTVTCSAQDTSGNYVTAMFSITVVDTTSPSITVPSDITVEATGPVTIVTYTASAVDTVDGSVPVQCSPPPGSQFPLGSTTTTCTAQDKHGNVGVSSFSITVRDTTPPETTIASAMDGNGYPILGGGRTPSTSVTFNVQSSDLVGVAHLECSLDSQPFTRCQAPTTYPGLSTSSHTYRVRAVDTSDNRDPTPASFTWIVRSPSQAVQDLIDQVNMLKNSGKLHSAQEGGLLSLLTKAQTDLSSGSTANAITDLKLFISHVQILVKNGMLANADGKTLTDYACDIVKVLGGTC